MSLPPGAEAADQLADAREPVLTQVLRDPLVHLLANEWIIEERRADAHRGSSRDEKLQCVRRRRDAALPDDGYPVRLRYFIHLVNLEQRDRLDRRPREAALNVADHRP